MHSFVYFSFFIHTPPPTQIYPLSLHDALPISPGTTLRTSCTSTPTSSRSTPTRISYSRWMTCAMTGTPGSSTPPWRRRSEEHTSELQSRGHLVCRLLLEKKKNNLASYYT